MTFCSICPNFLNSPSAVMHPSFSVLCDLEVAPENAVTFCAQFATMSDDPGVRSHRQMLISGLLSAAERTREKTQSRVFSSESKALQRRKKVSNPRWVSVDGRDMMTVTY